METCHCPVMAWSLAAFDTLPWTAGAHPLESKKVADNGLVLLRFEPGFSDPNWCERSHVLYVVAGTLSVELEATRVELGPGQALWLEPGTRHRAAVTRAEPVVALAVSDIARMTH
jgi:quercetin dioxygenase-like cupin family protein